MKPTELEQLLIDYLKLSKANDAVISVVFLLLKAEEQQIEMCKYLSKYENATEEEILEQARKIVETAMPE